MPAQPEWLSADVAAPLIGVDRENKILRGYVVAQEGPFKTKGRGEFDEKSLRQIVKLMKGEPQGLKSRFTHPNMSNDGLGKFLGRSMSPRMDTVKARRGEEMVELKAVRADLHFDKTAFDTPSGNLAEYVLNLAESDPDALSSSLVLQFDPEIRLDNHGKPRRDPDTGDDLPPLWRPTRLHASDIVETGDAVDGLLSASAGGHDLAELLAAAERLRFDDGVRLGSQILDRLFAGQTRELVHARLTAFLGRYLDLRFGAENLEALDPGPEGQKKIIQWRRRVSLLRTRSQNIVA